MDDSDALSLSDKYNERYPYIDRILEAEMITNVTTRSYSAQVEKLVRMKH